MLFFLQFFEEKRESAINSLRNLFEEPIRDIQEQKLTFGGNIRQREEQRAWRIEIFLKSLQQMSTEQFISNKHHFDKIIIWKFENRHIETRKILKEFHIFDINIFEEKNILSIQPFHTDALFIENLVFMSLVFSFICRRASAIRLPRLPISH